MALKKVNLKKIENKKKDNEKKLKILTQHDDSYKLLVRSFLERFKHHFGSEYKFQDKRVTQAGKKLNSDFFRLAKIFDYLLAASKGSGLVASEMLCLIMDNWSEWDKAHPLNLVGFIENQCSDDEIGKFLMKAKKSNKDKKSLHNEDHRKITVEKHRRLFDEDPFNDYNDLGSEAEAKDLLGY